MKNIKRQPTAGKITVETRLPQPLLTDAWKIIGLYLNPPQKAIVLCVDEKSQIQALDRTQPGLPMKKGAAGRGLPITSATARRRCLRR